MKYKRGKRRPNKEARKTNKRRCHRGRSRLRHGELGDVEWLRKCQQARKANHGCGVLYMRPCRATAAQRPLSCPRVLASHGSSLTKGEILPQHPFSFWSLVQPTFPALQFQLPCTLRLSVMCKCNELAYAMVCCQYSRGHVVWCHTTVSSFFSTCTSLCLCSSVHLSACLSLPLYFLLQCFPVFLSGIHLLTLHTMPFAAFFSIRHFLMFPTNSLPFLFSLSRCLPSVSASSQ